jgi:hypothetical protein
MFAVVFWLPGSFQCAGVLFDVLRLGVGLLAVVILVLLLQLEGCWLCVGFFFSVSVILGCWLVFGLSSSHPKSPVISCFVFVLFRHAWLS